MMLPHIIITLLLVIAAGCSRPIDSRLLDAESVINDHPDSAIAILRSIDHKKLDRKNSMFASLLEVKAADKAYITATSDSAIKTLLRYYIDGNREKRLHPVVLYYAGRTYYDLGKIDMALRYFKKAAEKAGKNGDPNLLASIHSQIAGLYFDNHLYRHALRHGKLWLEYCRMLPDSSEAFNASLSVAFKYRMLAINDSAVLIYRRLQPMADTISDRIAASQFYTQFASFLISEGKLSEADSIVSSHDITWKKGSESAILTILNRIDARKGDSLQIEKRLRKLLNSPDMQPRQQAAKGLARNFLKRGEIDSAFRYTDLYAMITDSILDRHATMPLAEIEALITDAEQTNILLSKENEIQARNIIITTSCGLLLLLLAAVWIITTKSRLRTIENRKLKEEKEENKKIIDKYAIEIERLTDDLRIARSGKENDNKTKLLETGIAIRKTASLFMENHASMRKEEKRNLFEKLEYALSVTDPGFMHALRDLNLQERDFDDALLIKTGIPQNISAKILLLSPSGLGNARRRLLEKTGHNKEFKNWGEFILSLC